MSMEGATRCAVRALYRMSSRGGRSLGRQTTSTYRAEQIPHRSVTYGRRQVSSSASQGQDEERPRRSPEEIEGQNNMLNDFLDFDKRSLLTPTSRTSHFQSPKAQEEQRDSTTATRVEAPPDPQRRISPLSEMFAQFNKRSTANKMNTDNLASPKVAVSLDPLGNTNPPSPQKQIVPYPLPMRLDFTVGRTVRVDLERSIDVGKAFRQLDTLVRRNNIRLDHTQQRFHERPGLRRKRIKSQRWRQHFKEGFKGMVALVKRMKKQGW